MKPKHYILAIAMTAFASCSNCGGVNETVHYYAMAIENNGDTIKAVNGRYRDELRLIGLSWSENGDRKCHYKNYVVGYGETIDSNSVKVYCNKDIRVNGTVVQSGENLKGNPALLDYFSGMITIVLESSLARTANTYYVSGTTTKGNNFIDSVGVYYQ